MKKSLITICLILAFVMAFSPLCYAAGENYDTLADWNIKIAVPDDVTAVLKGNEYYLYVNSEGGIPYVMLTTYRYGDAEIFLADFTDYMQGQYADLQVTSVAEQKTIGDKSCYEIDYGYTVSGYDVQDRRVVITVGSMTYLFTSKEVASQGLTVGDMLEEVVANCEFLAAGQEQTEEATTLSAAYLYCQENGMPKYWLDLTGLVENNLVLHCYFRSGEPTFYESLYILDLATADFFDGGIEIYDVYDVNGFAVSEWFKSLTLLIEEDSVEMMVRRDERTLAGGGDDNILTGVYAMYPVGVGTEEDELAQLQTYPLPLDDGPYTAEELGRWAQIYYFRHNGFFPPEAEVEQNADGSFTIHLYELVAQDGATHTATSAWYTVDAYGTGVDSILEQPVELCS